MRIDIEFVIYRNKIRRKKRLPRDRKLIAAVMLSASAAEPGSSTSICGFTFSKKLKYKT
jgi:hypothetical protein